LWITSASVLTPLAAFFFIGAYCVDVVKKLFWLGEQVYRHYFHPEKADAEQDALNSLRRACAYLKHRNEAFINIAAASAVVAIVAAWCFIPGGIIAASAFAFSAMGIVFVIKKIASSINEKTIRKELQQKVSDLNLTLQEVLCDRAASPYYSPERVISEKPNVIPASGGKLFPQSDTSASSAFTKLGYGSDHSSG
jgi:hypothetical protein